MPAATRKPKTPPAPPKPPQPSGEAPPPETPAAAPAAAPTGAPPPAACVTLNRGELIAALTAATALAPARHAVPAYTAVRISGRAGEAGAGGGVWGMFANETSGVRAECRDGNGAALAMMINQAQFEAGDRIDVYLAARDLLAKVRSFTGELVRLTVDGFNAELADADSAFNIPALADAAFPAAETGTEPAARLPVSGFLRALRRTRWAVSEDGGANRFALHALRIEFEAAGNGKPGPDGKPAAGRCVIAGSDSRVLAEAICNADVQRPGVVLVHPSAADTLPKLLDGADNGTVEVKTGRSVVAFAGENFVAVFPQIEGTYPEYRGFLPDNYSRRVRVDAATLAACVERVALVDDAEHTGAVVISVHSGGLKMALENQRGRGTTNLVCKVDGEPLQIGFTPALLAGALKHAEVTGEVSVDMLEANRPLRVNAPDYFAIVQPRMFVGMPAAVTAAPATAATK